MILRFQRVRKRKINNFPLLVYVILFFMRVSFDVFIDEKTVLIHNGKTRERSYLFIKIS